VPSIGGRYSVLSPFGLVPASDCRDRYCRSDAIGAHDDAVVRPDVPPSENPGARLGIALGARRRKAATRSRS
jgi:transaldolase/glucose-6-phosphate isomerase